MTASSLCVFLYLLVLATLASEQKAKGEHFYTLDLLAFSFMSLEGGGQEMSVRVCVHVCVRACVHACVRACVRVCVCVCVCVCVVQLLLQVYNHYFLILHGGRRNYSSTPTQDKKAGASSRYIDCMVRVCVLAGSRSVQHLHVVVLLSLSNL